jgi:hypothetical protein
VTFGALQSASSGVDWTEVAIAVFTGATALSGWLLFRVTRISAGHGQSLRLRRPRGDYVVAGAESSTQWPDRTRIRVARLHVFNRSDRRQYVRFDHLKTGIIWPRFDEPPRVAVRNLEIRGDEGNNVLIPLESGTWPDDIIDPRTGFSRRTYWLRIEGVSQNGKRLFWFGPVHIREAPGYSQPPGQFG